VGHGIGAVRIPVGELCQETFQLELRHHVLPGDFRVRAVLEDRDGTIWLGSESKGLILLQRRYQRSLGHRDAVVPIENGSYWALQPDRKEADRLRDGTVVERLPLADVHRISRAQRGGLWVLCGSADQPQLVRYVAGQTETHPWPKALRHDMPVYEDCAGRLWQREDWQRWQSFAFKDGEVVETVREFCWARPAAARSGLHSAPDDWAATRTVGLRRLQARRPNRHVVEFRDIHEDRTGRIWVSTYGEGLWRVRDDQVSPRDHTARAAAQHARGDLRGRSGRLWINSNEVSSSPVWTTWCGRPKPIVPWFRARWSRILR